jgi:hypothetical protein
MPFEHRLTGWDSGGPSRLHGKIGMKKAKGAGMQY